MTRLFMYQMSPQFPSWPFTWQLNYTAESSYFNCGVQVVKLRDTVQTITQVRSLKVHGDYLINLMNSNKYHSLINLSFFRSNIWCLPIFVIYCSIKESSISYIGFVIWNNWRNSQGTTYPSHANTFVFCWEHDLIFNGPSDHSKYTCSYYNDVLSENYTGWSEIYPSWKMTSFVTLNLCSLFYVLIW